MNAQIHTHTKKHAGVNDSVSCFLLWEFMYYFACILSTKKVDILNLIVDEEEERKKTMVCMYVYVCIFCVHAPLFYVYIMYLNVAHSLFSFFHKLFSFEANQLILTEFIY